MVVLIKKMHKKKPEMISKNYPIKLLQLKPMSSSQYVCCWPEILDFDVHIQTH